MDNKRKPISKRMRFEVLKRDSFTCQYCGKQPPDVILHIDHIKPVSKGGKNTMLNLVTSCSGCNLGKSNKELSDDSAVKKQQAQIKDLAEKKAQIEMMIKWRESLEDSEQLLIDSVIKLIEKLMVTKTPNDQGKMLIRKAIKKRGYQAVFDSVNLYYTKCDSVDDFSSKWSKGLLFVDNGGHSLNYAKGIMRNRFYAFNETKFYVFFNGKKITDDILNEILDYSKTCDSVNEFYCLCEEII